MLLQHDVFHAGNTLNSSSSIESPEHRLLEPELESRKNELIESLDLDELRADEAFDRIASAAASVCESSAALVTLVGRDQQFTLGSVGSDIDVIPRDDAFCTYTIQSDEPLITYDARQDERFASSSLVQGSPYLRFYAGARYKGAGNTPLGAVCAVDTESRNIDTVAQAALQALASQVERHLMTYVVARGYELSEGWFEHTRPGDGEQEFVLSVEDQAQRLSKHITEIQADVMMSRFSDDETETRRRMLNWKIDRDIGRAQEKLVGILEAARNQEVRPDSVDDVPLGEVLGQLFGDIAVDGDLTVEAPSQRELWRLFQTLKSLIVSAGAIDIDDVDVRSGQDELAVSVAVSGDADAIHRLTGITSISSDQSETIDAVTSRLTVLWSRIQDYARAVDAGLLFLADRGGAGGEWVVRL